MLTLYLDTALQKTEQNTIPPRGLHEQTVWPPKIESTQAGVFGTSSVKNTLSGEVR